MGLHSRSLLRDTRGAGLLEYIVLVGLIGIVCLLGYRQFGSSIETKAEAHAGCVETFNCAGNGEPGAYTATEAALTAPGTEGAQPPPPGDGDGGGGDGGGKSIWDRVVDFGKGFFVDGLWGTVTGIWNIVTHPIETVKGLWHAVTNPIDTFNAIKDSVVQAWNENPERVIGAGIFELITLPVAALKVSKVGKVAKATRVVNAADDAADTARVVNGVDNAADAARAAALAKVAKDFKTTPLKPDYVGEHLPGGSPWGTQVDYLDDAARAQRQLHVRDGKIYDANGNLFDTTSAHTAHSGGGRAIFVMDENGNIFASTYQEVGRFHHSSLSAGQPVTSAGELVVENGVVKVISNKSGHYQPSRQLNEQVLRALEAQGVDTRGITLDNIGP